MERLRRKVNSADDEMILNERKMHSALSKPYLAPTTRRTYLKVRPAYIYDEKFSAGGLWFLHHFV